MAGESLVQVTEGVGKKLHTWQRTIGANSVEDEFVVAGLPPYPTYSAVSSGGIASGADHIFQLMAGSSLNVYVTRIKFTQATVGTASVLQSSVLRLSTAGTGGGVVTPRPLDSGDTAAGATVMTVPTAKGTEGVELWRPDRLNLVTAAPLSLPTRDHYLWEPMGIAKPIRIPAGTSNGICLKNTGAGIATDTIEFVVEFFELAY